MDEMGDGLPSPVSALYPREAGLEPLVDQGTPPFPPFPQIRKREARIEETSARSDASNDGHDDGVRSVSVGTNYRRIKIGATHHTLSVNGPIPTSRMLMRDTIGAWARGLLSIQWITGYPKPAGHESDDGARERSGLSFVAMILPEGCGGDCVPREGFPGILSQDPSLLGGSGRCPVGGTVSGPHQKTS